MSAIVGVYYFDGRPADRTNLEEMVEILAHRGPDGADVWCRDSIGLGHRMLWTTPESLDEKLPLANQTGGLVITADARIDNRDELIATLGLTGRPFGEIADSELILAAYEKWGEHCLEKLLGGTGANRPCSAPGTILGSSPFTTIYLTGFLPLPPKSKLSFACLRCHVGSMR